MSDDTPRDSGAFRDDYRVIIVAWVAPIVASLAVVAFFAWWVASTLMNPGKADTAALTVSLVLAPCAAVMWAGRSIVRALLAHLHALENPTPRP